MKYVAIGCDTFHAYSFFLPFVCLFWKERIGYEPILFLVGTEEEWLQGHLTSRVVLKALTHTKQKYEWIDHVPGVPSATVAQCVRHHMGALERLSGSDIIMTSDSDLFPVSREFFHQHDPMKHAIVLYYSNVYGDKDHWTNLHMSFTVDALRETMGLKVGDIRGSMLEMFKAGDLASLIEAKKNDPADDRLWFFDERYPSRKIMESRFYPKSVLKIPRDGNPPKDQNSRGAWSNDGGCIDYHAPRPGWTERYWPIFRPILTDFFPGIIEWADRYRAEFWEVGPDK